MSETCQLEREVLHAAADEQWTDALRAHAADCETCAAAMLVAPWMTRFARISDREHMLPDPSIVWLKAKLLQTTAEVNRASRPMDIVQMIAYVVVAAGWAALLTWRGDALVMWLRSFTPGGMMHSVANAESLSMSLFGVMFALASMTVLLALHTILAED